MFIHFSAIFKWAVAETFFEKSLSRGPNYRVFQKLSRFLAKLTFFF